MRSAFSTLRQTASTIATVLSAAGCGAAVTGTTGVDGKSASSLVVVQGASQAGQAGRELPTAVVFRVINANGAGMPGVTVTLTVAAGGGTVTPASDTTDAHGEFKSKWTLGAGNIVQQLAASVHGVDPVIVSATGLLPAQIILVQGNSQSAKAATAATNSIIVRVVGTNNIPMVGVTVGFQVLAGGGGMTPATVVTNAFGEASTKWTLGAVGANVASVTSGTLLPVSLTATATP